MAEYSYHSPETAPEAARPMLEDAKRQYGMVPNLYAKMAEAPTLLEAYLQVSGIFARSSLTTTEQQVVLLAASRANQCEYCMGAHSVLADMAEVPVEITDAIRNDRTIPDARQEALRRFTSQLVERRGWLDDAEVQSFLDAGFTRENLLDVIVGVSQKILSNYTNHIAGTELDSAFAHRSWKAPA